MVKEEFTLQDEAAPFNMALATLEALRSILTDIKKVSFDPYISDEARQKLKINLIKRFYVDSAPLLPEDVVGQYSSILQIKPKTMKIMDKEGQEADKERIVYSEELDEELDSVLINLQIELQREKYYMPPKMDKGSAVARF